MQSGMKLFSDFLFQIETSLSLTFQNVADMLLCLFGELLNVIYRSS